jgi:stage V sporulation protein K
MSFVSHSEAMRYIQNLTHQLYEPLQQCILSGALDPSIFSVEELMYTDLLYLVLYLGGADGQLSEDEIAFVPDLSDIFRGTDHARNWDDRQYRRQYLDIYKKMYSESREFYDNPMYPQTLFALTAYDRTYGTEFAEMARAMFFRFANVVVKSDGKTTEYEENALANYKDRIYTPLVSEQKMESNEVAFISSNESEEVSVDSVLSELNLLIGLDAVKSDVLQLVNFLQVQNLRASKGLKSVPISRHLVFFGNPGTGKTTVARLLAKIYKNLGIISKGHLVETDRSGLVAGYVGQTALKVREIVSSSLGGVLFIDEAYALLREREDYGQEAIDTLIKLMEDHRDDLIVIVAGYTEPMQKFLSSNPGLKSRFNKYFFFDDYSPQQLTNIFESLCESSGFYLVPEARKKVSEALTSHFNLRDNTFGNARLVRNLFEETLNGQANRLVSVRDIDERVLSEILPSDIPIHVFSK